MVDNATPVGTPIGQQCLDCGETVEQGDRGLLQHLITAAGGTLRPIHLECLLRTTLSHFYRQCPCYVPGRARRDEARATLAAINTQREAEGLGPL